MIRLNLMEELSSKRIFSRTLVKRVTAGVLTALVLVGSNVTYVSAKNGSAYFLPGNLVVSRSVYDNNPANVEVDMILPPNCVSGCSNAINDGTYPYVWNNNTVDGSFGITSKIYLDQINPADGTLVNSLEVPNSSQNGVPPTKDQLVTSFSSKSELALNLSTDGNYLTFMGYLAPIDDLDVSNSNTPEIVDATNPVPSAYYRVVAKVDQKGKFQFTETNAYSGNNGRAAILNNTGANFFYTSGNAGNGGDPQPDGIIIGAGAQIIDPEIKAMVAQRPGDPTPVGSFNIFKLCPKNGDKIGKDTNFRGLTIFDNVLYYTKGSGGNGINTVYFVDTTGQQCPYDCNTTPKSPGGIGLPELSAVLPTSGIPYDPSVLQTEGVTPYNMCILKGFPTALKSKTSFPFGLWFANANTLYVADEGNGTNTYDTVQMKYTAAAAQTTAGLQKWVFDSVSETWKLAYTLQSGLDLGIPYDIDNYPTGNNTTTGLPWAPATDGLRNITGFVNGDGTVTIWAITSTVSGNGDQGADPNKLVMITDTLGDTTLPAGESFTTVRSSGYGEVLRGVSFAPGTNQ